MPIHNLKAAREKTVRDHMRLENEGSWDDVLATFARQRLNLIRGNLNDYPTLHQAKGFTWKALLCCLNKLCSITRPPMDNLAGAVKKLHSVIKGHGHLLPPGARENLPIMSDELVDRGRFRTVFNTDF